MWKSAPDYGANWRRYFGNSRYFNDATTNVTQDSIARVYRKRALKLHPDKNPKAKNNAERAFKELGKYKELADKAFERFRPGPPPAPARPAPAAPRPAPAAPRNANNANAYAAAARSSLPSLLRLISVVVDTVLGNATEQQKIARLRGEGVTFGSDKLSEGMWTTSDPKKAFSLHLGAFFTVAVAWRVGPGKTVGLYLHADGRVTKSSGALPDERMSRTIRETMLDAYAMAKARQAQARKAQPQEQPRANNRRPNAGRNNSRRPNSGQMLRAQFLIDRYDGDNHLSNIEVIMEKRGDAWGVEVWSRAVLLGKARTSDRVDTVKAFRKVMQMNKRHSYYVWSPRGTGHTITRVRIGGPGKTWGKSRSMATATEFFDALLEALAHGNSDKATILAGRG